MKFVYKPIRELFTDSMRDRIFFDTFDELVSYFCRQFWIDSHDKVTFCYYAIDDRIYPGCKTYLFLDFRGYASAYFYIDYNE